MYQQVIKPILFSLSIERAHRVVILLLRIIGMIPGGRWLLHKCYGVEHPALEREVFGIRFRNPVGLAAGFDRNGEAFREFAALGFGFVEVGTVTPRPQPGNPRPRIFRLPKDRAIIQRTGLANRGLERMIQHLRRPHEGVIVGCNIGRNTSTPPENAPADYLKLFRSLYQYADYFTVNICCDNACRDGASHSRESILRILDPLFDFRRGQNQYRPIMLKVSPDMSDEAIDRISDILLTTPLDGIVATNGSLLRDGLRRSRPARWRSCAASTPARAAPTPSSASAGSCRPTTCGPCSTPEPTSCNSIRDTSTKAPHSSGISAGHWSPMQRKPQRKRLPQRKPQQRRLPRRKPQQRRLPRRKPQQRRLPKKLLPKRPTRNPALKLPPRNPAPGTRLRRREQNKLFQTMKATIITIGDEILIGQIVDTNSVSIAKHLNAAGIVVRELTGSNVVILTGGLGPTKDDITKKTLAEMFHSELVPDARVAEHVERMLTARGIEYNELNRSQSLVPACCTVLFNAHGTAPGMWFERDGRVVVSLPGVPFEMEHLMQDEVMPRLKARFALRQIVHRTMITAGLAESMLAEKIAPWENALPPYLKLAYLPSPGVVRLRLSAYEVEGESVAREIDRQFEALRRLIPYHVIGFERASMQELVHGILTQRGETLATAESCTGGAIAARFTAMPGASAYFLCGVVAYSNEAKSRILGVPAEEIARYGAVSEQVARRMAEGARRISGADYAVATTGIAGPTGGSDAKPVGTVWIAVATPRGTQAILKQCGTDRGQIIDRASAFAIGLLRDCLEEEKAAE